MWMQFYSEKFDFIYFNTTENNKQTLTVNTQVSFSSDLVEGTERNGPLPVDPQRPGLRVAYSHAGQ